MVPLLTPIGTVLDRLLFARALVGAFLFRLSRIVREAKKEGVTFSSVSHSDMG